jgi:pimeloyl-ACP methyl ester carboxylesterase
MTIKRYIDLDHGQVHVRISGNDSDPALVLLHQVPSSSMMWEKVMTPFAERGYRVIAMDLPGYGASDPLPFEPELSDYATVVAGMLAALGHETATVFGHHTGASVALVLAADHSATFRAVALWGIANHFGAEAAHLAEELPPAYGPDFITDVDTWWAMRLGHATPGTDGTVMARELAAMLANGVHRPDGHRAVGRTNHEELLARAISPVLLLTGSREMLDEITRIVAAQYPEKAELVVLGDNGMDVADDAPELLADTVDAFFSRVGAVNA